MKKPRPAWIVVPHIGGWTARDPVTGASRPVFGQVHYTFAEAVMRGLVKAEDYE